MYISLNERQEILAVSRIPDDRVSQRFASHRIFEASAWCRISLVMLITMLTGLRPTKGVERSIYEKRQLLIFVGLKPRL